ncbi:hypothetical protein DWB85_17685 [Seongchinamella sediminis]|uniref:MBL fold metallo-hydrolase n=1 Tax=Seongchinamella sediminis TaxID=2283635 RepID=A0A3L7DXA3_9GAMM|nr:hypothetical protein [Seongchinamella sediminis]RLQ20442.1 hypothetical protein DWB85_17685 [Seongchinamella sediminis]
MAEQIIHVAESFWNIRGSFRIGGVVEIGTQASLVQLSSGSFLLLDSYSISEPLREEIDAIVGDGEVEAILNLHPFHTVHVQRMHELFPDARLHGTQRHLDLFPDLPWEEVRSEDQELHDWYADDLDFTIPRGVDFISANENIHFASVLAYHRASGTIHADDTLMYIRLPRFLGLVGLSERVSFHPTLAMALEKREGAAAEFREWSTELADAWGEAENLCAAHSGNLLAESNPGAPISERIRKAADRCEPVLGKHERRYG